MFFSWSGAHRHLHSFPTRRSSDLSTAASVFTVSNPSWLSPPKRPVCRPYCVGGMPRQAKRSEEHTSELQSHSDLVCRLLLEKKKLFTAYGLALDAIQVQNISLPEE